MPTYKYSQNGDIIIMRYSNESKEKVNGVVYTPTLLADYLSDEMIKYSHFNFKKNKKVKVLDPAVGEGELLVSLISRLLKVSADLKIEVVGYEMDGLVADTTRKSLSNMFPNTSIDIVVGDFLDSADAIETKFDFIIANPPYIRTQILGADKAQEIAKKMNLSGRVDIYYAFLIYMKQMLSRDGISGYITSNKFFSIKSGASVRKFMLNNYCIYSVVDFGDTKLFSASVLPCTVVFSLGKTESDEAKFTSIYEERNEKSNKSFDNIFDVIDKEGLFAINDGRSFSIQQGVLRTRSKDFIWTLASKENNDWLDKVESNTWLHFSDIGKIRVGIKTTADNIFIGDDWTDEKADLEWLQPLITHRDAGQIISEHNMGWKVLYTHTMLNGKKIALNIEEYPKTKAYLEQHYEQLAGRKYVKEAHRNWYEIWVPQNPAAWAKRKIVFRDISERPEFWLDETGAVVNGDCYWIEIDTGIFEDVIYLALAVANSKFIEKYYDTKFNTKLYSGKRRYMSQYVEQFPIPYMNTKEAQKAIDIVKKIISGCDEKTTSRYKVELNETVDTMFAVN